MSLTALQVKQYRHSGGLGIDKLDDGKGLRLLVSSKNSKRWQLRYTFRSQRPEISLGVYPAISLADARDLAAKARTQIAQGIDPRDKRKAAKEQSRYVFDVIALEWWEKQSPTWSSEHAIKVRRWLEQDVFPMVGKLPIAEIDQRHVADIMLGIEKAGHPTSAAPTLSIMNRIFGHALAHRLICNNPAQGFPLRDIIQPLPKTKHRSAITEPKQLGQLMRDIENWDAGAYSTVQSLRLIPFIFLRPKEIRSLRWDYVDFDAALIRFPDVEMKKGREHLVPMATQVIEQLKGVWSLTRYSPYVFPSSRNSQKPMSKNVITNALRAMGYGADIMCGHGFRSTASTLLHEQEWSHDVIETQLAHLTGTATSRAYNRSKYLKERANMMQAWADYLDKLRNGADVISINAGKAA